MKKLVTGIALIIIVIVMIANTATAEIVAELDNGHWLAAGDIVQQADGSITQTIWVDGEWLVNCRMIESLGIASATVSHDNEMIVAVSCHYDDGVSVNHYMRTLKGYFEFLNEEP